VSEELLPSPNGTNGASGDELSACANCGGPILGICKTCKLPFCQNHKSEVDPHYCAMCVNDVTTEVVAEPIIDAEGVRHKGRHILLKGDAFRSTAKDIVDMSDDELDGWIKDYRELVKLAESSLTYRRICLTTAEFEQSERKHSAVRHLKLTAEEQERIKIVSEQKQRRKPKAVSLTEIAASLFASGLTPELLKTAMENLRAKGKLK